MFLKVSETDTAQAVCNICNDKAPRGKTSAKKKFNATNLVRHLEKMHAEEHVEFKKRSAEKEREKHTPKRMLKKNTTLDGACPYSQESEKGKGGAQGS